MKKLVLILLTLVATGAVRTYAQTTVDVQSCLLKEYKQAELDAMSADELAFEKFVVENAVQVYPVPEGKPTDIYPHKKWEVESGVCIYDLKVKLDENNRVNFFSKNDKLVMIYSKKELKKNYEQNK